MSPWDAVLIGVSGIAIVPGITRSGSTILAPWRIKERGRSVFAGIAHRRANVFGTMGLFKSGDLVHGFYPTILLEPTAFFSGIFAITVFIKLLMQLKTFIIWFYYCYLHFNSHCHTAAAFKGFRKCRNFNISLRKSLRQVRKQFMASKS